MKSLLSPSTHECLPRSPKGSRMTNVLLACGLLMMISGGVSSAWAGERGVHKEFSPYLHLTGLSVHIGPRGFHLGIGGYGPYRFYGPHRHFTPGPRFFGGPGKRFWYKNRFDHPRRGYWKPGRGHGHWKGKKHHRRHRKAFRGGRGHRHRR